MSIAPDDIKKLRNMTAAGMLDCKKALEATKGNMDQAIKYLREKGIAKAVGKMEREAKEGAIVSYIHHNNKIGVLLELNCETDFVAKNDMFLDLGKQIAMHIAAMSPAYIKAEDIPQDVISNEKEIQKKLLLKENKPENVIEKILDGKIKKYLAEISLLSQPFVKEPKKTIQDLIKESISTLGENITIGNFVRYSL